MAESPRGSISSTTGLRGRCPTGISHLPSPLQPLCFRLPNSRFRHDILRWWLHAAGLYSQHRGVWSEGKPTMFFSDEVGRWQTTGYSLLPRNPVVHCSPQTLQSRLHPQVRNCDVVAPLNRTLKILGVTLDTHFIFGPHARYFVEWASKALNIMKDLAGANWGFMTKTLVATYKAIVRPILNYAALIWFTQVSSSHLGKLEVIQNKALRIATGFHQQTTAYHLRAETGVLPLRAHLELCSLQTSYHLILRGLRVRSDYPNAPPLIFGGVLELGAKPLSQTPRTRHDDRGDRPVLGT